MSPSRAPRASRPGARRPKAAKFRRVPKQFRSSSEEFPGGLSRNEEAACRFIAEHGASRTAEIAEAIGMTPRGILKLLQRLESRGIVEGLGATSDRTYRLQAWVDV